ncbi:MULTISPECIES: protein kinase domain-containing protein [unclassified Streptomyces]|uniref:protein kinase domain-containing protein n=1 Tax=unclassified Streptomyces TaxID=2593676 RepID=UPI0011A8C6AC|nr:protein kinase [Streptomyces sp. BK340]TVZ79468.1 serine/threonine protein kinase [Streptomyces sp. BK340]
MPTPLTHDDPQAFGPYRPVARLGSGGMGTVYLARSGGGRTVAVKTMHAGIASDPGARTRFRLEADAARVIGGRHGAQVVEADTQAETPWIATEYVLGPPLDEAVELAGPLPEATVRALGAALCGALGQLHSTEVVHRDLKPSNILVTAYGPKVIDFGIARAIGDDRLTRVGAAVGTPAFMSPEQASGEEHTAAGDVFALAGVLVHAATGRAPFGHGQTADLLYRVRYGDPDLSDVPAALVPILGPCLDKNPFRRPTTSALAARLHDGSGEFAEHLPDALLAEIARRATEVWQITPRRLAAPSVPYAPPSAAPAAPAAPMSRRRLLLTGGAVALGGAAAGAGAWAWSRRSGAHEKQPVASPSNSLLPKKKLDSIWQIQVADPPYGTVPPAQPLVVGDLVTLVAGTGLGGIDAGSGQVRWTSEQMEIHWQIATDGERLVRMVAPPGSDGNAGKPGGFPLILASVDMSTGTAAKPFAQLTDFNGVISQNQVLCTADGVVYAAGGRGKYDTYFVASQSWSVFAVDISTGKKLWTGPLPSRPDRTDRLHFLTARVVGHNLVALQETNDGKVRIVVRDTRTGAVRWDKPFEGVAPDRVRGPLATDAQNLYLGNGRLRALRLSDGAQVWDSQTERPGRTYGPPAVKDGVVHAVEKGLGLVALGSADGRVRWEEKGGAGTKADVSAAPVIGTDYAYSKRSSELWAIDLSSHTPTASYKTTGNRFIAHEKARVTIALGGKFLAAFPLK